MEADKINYLLSELISTKYLIIFINCLLPYQYIPVSYIYAALFDLTVTGLYTHFDLMANLL